MGKPRHDIEAEVRASINAGEFRKALAALMDGYGDVVYSFCLRIVKDPALAEDVRQKVFLEAFEGFGKFGGASLLKTWLLGIAKNRSIDALRVVRRETGRVTTDDELLDEAIGAGAGPDALAGDGRARGDLERCLDSCVSPEEKALILLHYLDELSYEEMGTSLGKKADSLRARVARALPKLRRCLERHGVAL